MQSPLQKKISQGIRRSQWELGHKQKKLESNLNSEANFNEYKKDLFTRTYLFELIYERIDEGVKIRSKFQWYEQGEKSTKRFLNLTKKMIC